LPFVDLTVYLLDSLMGDVDVDVDVKVGYVFLGISMLRYLLIGVVFSSLY
jgi:hypothetical protein